jgi:hypothetical protein
MVDGQIEGKPEEGKAASRGRKLLILFNCLQATCNICMRSPPGALEGGVATCNPVRKRILAGRQLLRTLTERW